jgi:polysaccharide biosynthesis/export protein
MKRQKQFVVGSILSLLLTFLFLPACTPYRDLPAGTAKLTGSPVVSKEQVSVPTLAAEPIPPKDYLVGPGDVLLIDVNGRPEFTVASPGGTGKVQGSRVDGSGALHVPYIGSVDVAGLTLSQIEQKLKGLLKQYVQDPWVVVEIAEYKSLPVYLLGQFKFAGTYYMDRPLTLMQGLAMGGGFDPTANLKGSRLMRNGKIVAVDLNDLLLNGDTRQNVWLKGGDSIYIPDSKNQQVFVFGAVKKPGPVPIPPTGLNLLQAIANAELRDVGYDFRYVRIIRSLSTTRGELLVVDFEKVLKGESLPVQLNEGDVIYVPKSGFGNWNDAIAEMLPSLQVVSAVLQPFVSIKYLQRN